jgi:hypothetical protein
MLRIPTRRNLLGSGVLGRQHDGTNDDGDDELGGRRDGRGGLSVEFAIADHCQADTWIGRARQAARDVFELRRGAGSGKAEVGGFQS